MLIQSVVRPAVTTAACVAAASVAAALAGPLAAQEFAFKAETIDPRPGRVVYAVATADIDGDRRKDMIAVTENQVVWYQAPEWKKRIILDGGTQTDNVCVATHDIDGDGHVDLALGAGWPTNGGTIQWLARGQSLDDPWQVYPIDQEPWVHRMRFADVLGTGRPQLIVSPLNATAGPGVRLLAFAIPDDPRADRWPMTVLDASLDRMHNHWCVPPSAVHLAAADHSSDANSRDAAAAPAITLTASQQGIHAILPAAEGDEAQNGDGAQNGNGAWNAVRIAKGREGDEPASQGAGEIRHGKLAGGGVFLATIEPMHGSDVAVYLLQGDPRHDPPQRQLIDEGLRGGHALACADLDGDGDDEIVAGHREPAPEVGIQIYDRQSDGSWKKHPIDVGSVACEDLVVADFNNDGRLDILAGGRATHNVRLFINQIAPR